MRYLLERLAAPPLPAHGQFEAASTATLVAAQIQRIVSARPVTLGPEGIGLLDFGLAHVVEQGLHEQQALQRYALRLTRLIARYEPRLLRPATAIRKTGQALMPYQLVVTGKLAPDAEPTEFFFELPMP